MSFPTLKNAKEVKPPLKKKYNNIYYHTLSSHCMAASGSPSCTLYPLVLKENSRGKHNHFCFSVEKSDSESLSE